MNTTTKTILMTVCILLMPLSLALNYFYAVPPLLNSFQEVKSRYSTSQPIQTAEFIPNHIVAQYENGDALPQVRKIEGGFGRE